MPGTLRMKHELGDWQYDGNQYRQCVNCGRKLYGRTRALGTPPLDVTHCPVGTKPYQFRNSSPKA